VYLDIQYATIAAVVPNSFPVAEHLEKKYLLYHNSK
jgi:hypothetical protein